FCIPLTVSRGQCSTPPLHKLAERYRASGKDKLVVLTAADLDPDGDAWPHSLAQRLCDDEDIPEKNVKVIKCALTMKQAIALNLPEKKFGFAKEKSPSFARYVERYGTNRVWEQEAVPPPKLQQLMTDAAEAVIDLKLFNIELAKERKDNEDRARRRAMVGQALRKMLGFE